VNKTELIAAMAEKTELPRKDVEAALKAFEDVVSEELQKGEKVQIVALAHLRCLSGQPGREGIPRPARRL